MQYQFKTLPFKHLVPALLLIGLLQPQSAAAAWSEGDRTIVRADEVAAQLGAGLSPRGGVATDQPILLPPDWRELGSKVLPAAIIMSGLGLSREGGGLELVNPHALSERERAERRRVPSTWT